MEISPSSDSLVFGFIRDRPDQQLCAAHQTYCDDKDGIRMGRFLSPAKIAIVILIDLYYHRKAQPSDTIQVLSFISQHILRPADDTVVQVNGYQPLSLKDFEILLSPLKSDFPGRPLWHVYLKYLWSHTSLECLDDLFSRVSTRGCKFDERLTLYSHAPETMTASPTAFRSPRPARSVSFYANAA